MLKKRQVSIETLHLEMKRMSLDRKVSWPVSFHLTSIQLPKLRKARVANGVRNTAKVDNPNSSDLSSSNRWADAI